MNAKLKSPKRWIILLGTAALISAMICSGLYARELWMQSDSYRLPYLFRGIPTGESDAIGLTISYDKGDKSKFDIFLNGVSLKEYIKHAPVEFEQHNQWSRVRLGLKNIFKDSKTVAIVMTIDGIPVINEVHDWRKPHRYSIELLRGRIICEYGDEASVPQYECSPVRAKRF